MKKLLFFMVTMLMPMMASADAVEINGIYYNLISKGKIAEVTKSPNYYTGSITIPSSVTYNEDEYDVKYVGKEAFANCTGLTTVTIPNSVIDIGVTAFIGCTGLNSITIPNSVTSIGESAFAGCTSLVSIEIPESVTTLGWSAFWGCTSLTSVTIPNSITYLGSTFGGCTGLTSVTIPSSVTTIDGYTFYQCNGLKSIELPKSVTSIGIHAFDGCKNLTSVNIPDNVKSIDERAFFECEGLTFIDIPNSVITIGTEAFGRCTGLTSITIPNSVVKIEAYAFSGCTGLSSVTIGSGVNNICLFAFAYCPALTDVYSFSKTVPQTQNDVFTGSYIEEATLHVPKQSINAYQSVDPWKNFKDIVKIDMPKYSLIYMVDGEVYKTMEIEEGELISPEPTPVKEGYTFTGWSEIPVTMPDHDVTVTGTFTINKFKLNYFVDGEEYKSYDMEYGATITPEPAPTKEGHTFSGWSEIPKAMPAHDVTVTGTFSINKFKLTYIVDGGEYKSYELDYGASITPEAAPTKEGYTFSGWSEIPETMPAHDVTVTGTFSINSYKLTYMIDDKVYKETMYEYGATITPEPQPEGDYATFEWKDLPQTMPAHDVIVYASYTSGIIEVLMTTQRNIRIYSPNGKKLDKLQKGLNIVILDDGIVRKVAAK